MNYATLPNLLALSILVSVFWAISRKNTGYQVQVWLVGWALILLHFVAGAPAVRNPVAVRLATALSLDCLFLASVTFVISVSAIATSRRRQIELAVAIGLPCLAYSHGQIWEISSPVYYYVLLVIGPLAPLTLFLRYSKKSQLYKSGGVVATLAVTAAAAAGVVRGNPGLGITVLLASLNLAAAFMYWNQYKRTSAGVLTTVAGFLFWGAVFPTSLLLEVFVPLAKIESEVWNIPKYLVAVGMILTLLEDQIARSTYLAYHDALTELPNRRLLDDRLDQAIVYAARNRSKIAVFVLDLDHFKEVNDSFGHRFGDATLRKVVERLSSRIRASDTLARSGGDEFTVLSHVSSSDGAEVLLQGLESALEEPIFVEGKEVQTGVSIGVAVYPDDGQTADELHAAADRAMYVAKTRRPQFQVLHVVEDCILLAHGTRLTNR